MRVYSFLLVFAAAFMSSCKSKTSATISSETNIAQGAASSSLHFIDVLPTKDNHKRFLRRNTGEGDDGDGDTNNEERGVTDSLKKLSTKLKMLTNKDLRNAKLFLEGVSNEKLYKKLYEKGATPFKLFVHMEHKGIPNTGEIKKRWSEYFNYWVNRNAGKT